MRNRPVPTLPEAAVEKVRGMLIHEDRTMLAFNKPAGLAVQTRGNRGETLDHLLWAFARSNGKRPKLVHRLDAGTSGVIVAAQTQPAAAHLSEQFASRTASKTYLALVSGHLPEADEGLVSIALRRAPSDRGGRERMVPAEPGQKGAQTAETAWRVLSRKGVHALIEARPLTGRMHQIRAHLAHLGCPILGDRIYGAGKLSAARLMLHARQLEITHPDGTPMILSAPCPEEFNAEAAAIGLETGPGG